MPRALSRIYRATVYTAGRDCVQTASSHDRAGSDSLRVLSNCDFPLASTENESVDKIIIHTRS